VSHPEDTQAVHIETVGVRDLGRLDDALSASDRGLDVELLRPEDHDGVVLVGPELALGHVYTALDEHADEWADEGEGNEMEACNRLRDDLYEGLPNARAAVGLARTQQGLPKAGDREAVEQGYCIYGRADQ